MSTPLQQTRSLTWPSRYNNSNSTDQSCTFPPIDSLFPPHNIPPTPVTPNSASYPPDFHPSHRPSHSTDLSSPIDITFSNNSHTPTQAVYDPFVTPEIQPRQTYHRYSAPPAFDTPMSDYPNTPSPQSYGIVGSHILTEQGMTMRSSSSGGDTQDLFNSKQLSQSLPQSRPVLRPTQSHNVAAIGTPTPTSASNNQWPRRTMTDNHLMGRNQAPPSSSTGTICGSVPIPTPSAVPVSIGFIATGSNDSQSLVVSSSNQPNITPTYQVQSLSLSSSTSSTDSSATSDSAQTSSNQQTIQFGGPHSHNQNQDQPLQPGHPHSNHQHHHPGHGPGLNPSYSNHNDDLSAYTSYQGAYEGPYGSTPWQSHPSSLDYYQPHMPPYYHHGHHHPGLPPMHTPYKQEEPILAPGEIPAPRPPNSYAALIGEALLLAPPPHQLYVSEISESVKRRYVYYRQNPSKIYNGVRHQTSMCKAFVKLPRPFGDQSGGARKWAIRAGCEGWFLNGGYNPPGTVLPGTKGGKVNGSGIGKAKTTARAKALAIGTPSNGRPSSDKTETDDSVTPTFDSSSFSQGGGPSVGPAWDPSRSGYPHPLTAHSSAYSQPQTTNGYSYSAPAPGYHYVPISHPHPPPSSLPSQPQSIQTYNQPSYSYYAPYWPQHPVASVAAASSVAPPYSNPSPISPVQNYPSSAPATVGKTNGFSPHSSPEQQWRGGPGYVGSENGNSSVGGDREHNYHREALMDNNKNNQVGGGRDHRQSRPLSGHSSDGNSARGEFSIQQQRDNNQMSSSPRSSLGPSPRRYD